MPSPGAGTSTSMSSAPPLPRVPSEGVISWCWEMTTESCSAEAGVTERLVELLGGEFLATHAGVGGAVHLHHPGEARGADDDVLDEHIAVGT